MKTGGRRPKLTDEVERIIVETLRVGATFEAAAGRCGVAVDTIHEWRQRGAGKHPTRPSTARLARFALAVEKALSDAEVRCVGTITKASQTQWQAAAWLLERRHPSRYGRADRHQMDLRVEEGARATWDPSLCTTEELAQMAEIQRAALARKAVK